MDVDGYDWDEHNFEKCQAHGVSIADIEAFFCGEIAIRPDIAHSGSEERLLAIGKNAEGRYMFVVFTVRERDAVKLIRPISARHMHAKEVQRYEKDTQV